MSEMVERVARALRKADWPDDRGWQGEVKCARAALAEMREPTDEMLESLISGLRPDELVLEASVDGIEPAEFKMDGLKVAWRLLIDAALQEPPRAP